MLYYVRKIHPFNETVTSLSLMTLYPSKALKLLFSLAILKFFDMIFEIGGMLLELPKRKKS